jgi:cytochrome P450
LAKGLVVFIPVFLVHKDPRIWGSDVNEFKPERFEKENIAKIHPYAYMPFLEGPRKCPAMNYANYSMKITLCHVLSKYKFHTSLKLNELEIESYLAMKIRNGWMLTITKR